MRKVRNVILYNIPESNGFDEAAWYQDDLSQAINALRPIKHFNRHQIWCRRIGDYIDNVKRPLRVTLPQPGDVLLVLKDKFKLRNGFDAKQDLTSFQIDRRQQLWNEKLSLEKKGIYKNLKFINNTPTLVDPTNSHHDSPDFNSEDCNTGSNSSNLLTETHEQELFAPLS